MLKEFRSKVVNTSMLKVFYNEIVSTSFMKLDIQNKKNILINLDEYISEYCGMPPANFMYEDNYDNEVKDDLYIGDIDKYESGFDLLSKYFFLKRLQFQMNCIYNDELENYRDSTFYLAGISYKYAPLTNERLYFSYNEGMKKYLSNMNVFEAYMYACEEMGYVFDVVDYEYVYQGCSAFEKFKFLSTFKLAIDKNKKFLDKLGKKMSNEKEYTKFTNIIKMLQRKEINEKKYLTLLQERFDNKSFDDVSGKMLIISCFDERVWKIITPVNRIYVVNKFNQILKNIYSIDDKSLYFDKKRLIETDAGKISVGNIKDNNSQDIFNSLVYTYTYYYLLNNIDGSLSESEVMFYKNEVAKYRYAIKNEDYAKLKDCKLIKLVSDKAVENIKTLYETLNNSSISKQHDLCFFVDEDKCVYDLNKEINKKRKR